MNKTIVIKGWIILLLSQLWYGCASNQKESDTIYVDLEAPKADANDFFDDWRYVALKTTNGVEDGLIGTIKHIAIDDSTIVIQANESEDILIYDRSGNLITKFNRHGQGPHEYLDANRIKLKDGNIWLICKMSKRLIQYDKAGNYISQYKLPYGFGDFRFIDDETVILDSDFTNGSGYNFIVYNLKDENVLGQILPFDIKKGMSRGTLSSSFISNGTDKIYLTQIFDNNIYELTSNSTLEVAYKYDFNSEFKVSDEDLQEMTKVQLYDLTAGQNYVRWFGPGYWTGDICYQYLDCYPPYIYKHNWSTGEGSLLSIGNTRFTDFPFLCSKPITVYDGNYVSVLQPFNIDFIENKIGKKIITDSVEITDDSNPVLFFHHFKN